MKKCDPFNKIGFIVLVAALSMTLFACAGQQAQPEQPAEPVAKDPPLANAYKKVLIDNFKIPADLETDYREAVNQCQQSTIWALQDKKIYQSVDRFQANQSIPKDALIVRVTVPEMRVVGGAARFWVGAMAGSSYMNMNIEFIDAGTKAVLREKEISSSNNAWGAAWSGGSTDKNLPSDMGKILAEYIHSIIPK